MKHVKRTGALVIAFACGAIAAGAQPAADPKSAGDPMWKTMDANGDGKISPEEHAAGASRMFATMDANGDGRVTAEEMAAAHGKVTGARPAPGEMTAAEKIKVIDTDGDGVLSAAEHTAGSKAMFDRMDTDKDGFLSKAEMAAGHAMKMRKNP